MGRQAAVDPGTRAVKPRSARGQPLPSHAPLPSGRSAAAPGWAHAGASGVERLRSIDDFRNLRDAWQALHEACTDRVTPFNSWEWAFSWWQTYGERRELVLLVARDAAGVAGIAPLYLARETAAPGIQASVLHIVGDGSNDSDYLGFILRPGVEAQVLEQMCDWLSAHRQWDAVALRELPEHSPLPKVLAGLARRRGWRMRIENGRCAALDRRGGRRARQPLPRP
jgi:CelD/BcsL family acetyltransferase involved in cellulose biosynthesis